MPWGQGALWRFKPGSPVATELAVAQVGSHK
jgi:hypothetical protein